MTVHFVSGRASDLVAWCLGDWQYTSYAHGRDAGALSPCRYRDSDAPLRALFGPADSTNEDANRRGGSPAVAMVRPPKSVPRGTWCVGAIRIDEHQAHLGQNLGGIAVSQPSLVAPENDLRGRHLQVFVNERLKVLGGEERGQIDVGVVVLPALRLAGTAKGAHKTALRQDAAPILKHGVSGAIRRGGRRELRVVARRAGAGA